MPMIKILYLIDRITEAGAQKHLLELIKGLDRKKFQPWLIILSGIETEFELGVPVINLNVKRIYDISGIKGFFRLVALIRKEKFDVVHSYLFSENILGSIAAKIARVPIVITSRRDTGMLMQGKLRHILAYRLTDRFVDKIICVSEAVKRVVLRKEKVSPKKLEVIYNGVDIGKFSRKRLTDSVRRESFGIKKNEFVVGMIANFSWIKGHKDFLETAKLVLEELPNTKFLLIGDGSLKDDLKFKVKSLNLEDKVLFLGKRQDTPELFSITDVSVNASYSEGMSNAILESMAAGVSVVATAVDGNLETVADKETGLLVPPGHPPAMAKAIITLLNDKGLRENFGRNAKKIVREKFTSKIMLSNMESLYKELLIPKTGFILSQFPETHETFILRELTALKERKLNFVIFSLKRCKDKVVHPEAKELLKQTLYGVIYSLWSVVYSLRHPIRTISAFLYVIKSYYRNPKELIKGLYVFLECFYFARVIRRQKIPHIHAHWATMPTTAAMILSKLTSIPFSFAAHAWDIFTSQDGLVEKIDKAKFICTCTDYNRKYLLDLANNHQNKIYLNYHGLDLDKFQTRRSTNPQTRQLNILSIGRLVETKGFEYLIDVCGILQNKGIDFRYQIVGEGPLEGSLRFKTKSLKLDDKVLFLGIQSQEEIKKLYSKATVLVQPSVIAKNGDRDGIPNVILEAMAMGVPVISTNISGIPEVVRDGQTGIVVSQKQPQTLAEAIERLSNNEALQETLTKNARKIVEEQFEINRNVEQLMRIFKSNINEINGVIEQVVTRPKPINVLYIIWSLGLGGAERVAINTVKYLDKSRYHPIVCCLNEKGEFAQELEDIGIKVIPMHKKGKVDLQLIGKLAKLMREHNIDIVHTHLWGANFWGRIAARMARVKVIIATEHNVDVWKTGFHFILDRWLSRWTDKVIAVSNSVRDFYINRVGLKPKKIEVIYNGIDSTKTQDARHKSQVKIELGIDDGEIALAVIGRLVPEKGQRYFLLALKELSKKHKVKGLIIGSGPLEKELKQFSQDLGLDGNAIFTGLRQDVPSLLQAIDILVMPSLREGLPIVALEAMTSGVPVVASRVGGTPEVVIDGQTGILVEPKNHIALKEAISRLISEKDFSQRLINSSKKWVQSNFNIATMVDKTQNLYNKLYEINLGRR